jgi:hypothetical protein
MILEPVKDISIEKLSNLFQTSLYILLLSKGNPYLTYIYIYIYIGNSLPYGLNYPYIL